MHHPLPPRFHPFSPFRGAAGLAGRCCRHAGGGAPRYPRPDGRLVRHPQDVRSGCLRPGWGVLWSRGRVTQPSYSGRRGGGTASCSPPPALLSSSQAHTHTHIIHTDPVQWHKALPLSHRPIQRSPITPAAAHHPSPTPLCAHGCHQSMHVSPYPLSSLLSDPNLYNLQHW